MYHNYLVKLSLLLVKIYLDSSYCWCITDSNIGRGLEWWIQEKDTFVGEEKKLEQTQLYLKNRKTTLRAVIPSAPHSYCWPFLLKDFLIKNMHLLDLAPC